MKLLVLLLQINQFYTLWLKRDTNHKLCTRCFYLTKPPEPEVTRVNRAAPTHKHIHLTSTWQHTLKFTNLISPDALSHEVSHLTNTQVSGDGSMCVSESERQWNGACMSGWLGSSVIGSVNRVWVCLTFRVNVQLWIKVCWINKSCKDYNNTTTLCQRPQIDYISCQILN